MTTVTLQSDWAEYGSGAFWFCNNVWNNGTLQNGHDYIQSITYDPAAFPNNSLLSWSWPSATNADYTYSFPEIIYGYANNGYAPSSTTPPEPTQIANFTDLSCAYSLSI